MSEASKKTQEFDSESVIIDNAVPKDAEAIFEVKRQTWLETYPNQEAGITDEDIRLHIEGENGELIPSRIDSWKKSISEGNRICFVARLGDKVIGFASPISIGDKHRVGAIYLLPEAQGKGIGAKLMQKTLDWLGKNEEIYVGVASYNRKSIEFYKKFGFQDTGELADSPGAHLANGKTIPEIEMVLKPKLN